MLKNQTAMDPTLVTASMYTFGGIANLIVVLNILKRWSDRSVSFSISFSIGVVCLLTSCGKAIFDIYQDKFTPYQAKVFLFWYVGQIHLITNAVLIFTIQRALTVVVRPHWVRVTVTRRASDKCVTMQWFLMMVMYSPVLMVQFLMKKTDLEELLLVLKDVVTLIVIIEAFVILMLTLLIIICLIVKGRPLEPNEILWAEEVCLQRYWMFLVFFYFMILPDFVFYFITWYRSPTLDMLKSVSCFGMAMDFIVFFMVLN
eukprot:TCONS_00065178-protein